MQSFKTKHTIYLIKNLFLLILVERELTKPMEIFTAYGMVMIPTMPWKVIYRTAVVDDT